MSFRFLPTTPACVPSPFVFAEEQMKAVRLFIFAFLAVTAARADDGLQTSARLAAHHVAPGGSGRPLTLSELEALALENNPEIKVVAQRIGVLEARVPIAGALDDPSLMYRGWGVPLRKPWNYNQAQNMFMAGQSFPGRGKRGLRTQVAAQSVEIARAELKATKRETLARVRLAFYKLLRSYDEIRLHHEQVALAEQAVESARIKFTVGRVPQQDVLKAHVALSKLVDHLAMFERDADLARAELNTLTGRDPAIPLEISGEYPTPVALPPAEELMRVALANRPELDAANKAVEQGNTAVRLAEKAYSPDFNVSAGYMLMPAGSRFRNTYMAEVSINLPWFNRKRHDAEIAEAKAETRARTAEYEMWRADGLDEISLSRETHIADVRDGAVRSYTVTPEDFGLPRAPTQDLAGGDAAENAAIIRCVLDGEPGP
ncbi:MAG: TolC family protein, partial [Opitutaceae bacterium]